MGFFTEFKDCLLDYKYWYHFSLINTKIKYRDTVIGPFWNIISQTILILAITFGYSSFFNNEKLIDFIYYTAIGLFIWIFAVNCLNDSTSILDNKKNIILEQNINIKSFIFELIFSNFIIYLHSFIIIFILFFISTIKINIYFLVSFLGLFIILINIIFLTYSIMVLSVIFKDVKKIIENLLIILFFSTPIIWSEELMNEKLRFILNFNPCYHLLNIFRNPSLNKINQEYFYSLFISVIISFMSIAFSYYIEKKYKKTVKLYL
jgi:ABC-type polysaccharide/polyol phosphate export permease